ncbi:hypothetical protein [Fusibacter ferrireducens]|uniref:Uncharacterized protein n=1 Tax=Fusibacter ferrireducens TaxID=2785058 RepID=A0ABR9ZNU9_9FIRM|nr:hypothetical protein [Fusibacter ferrireducens]MBF4692142.1 hypothetical protein [Fusibacter ferrireducens]
MSTMNENENRVMKHFDRNVAILFAILSLAFIVLMGTDHVFFEWAFSRHQNILSWYIRPIFMIPICYFAFKRNATGISATIFLMFISMFWFPKPVEIDPKVADFLAMERVYLTQNWTITKMLVTSIVPISMGLLIRGLWQRNIKAGVGVLIGIAVGKIIWSVAEGGASGAKVIVPAILGLGICIVAIVWWYKKRYLKS